MVAAPEFLAIGHVTRDIQSDNSFLPGGTVTFAALTASRLGLTAGIVTCADANMQAALPAYLPGVALQMCTSIGTTTFANHYQDGFRTQYLYARAALIESTDLPAGWQDASIVLLGPLAQEISPAFVRLFPRWSERIVAATPQGWLRRWDADGRVWPVPWEEAEQILPLLDVLILSHDDLLTFANGSRAEADSILQSWSLLVPLLIATDGRHGATLFRHGVQQHFPAYRVRELDSTGAGDVFAAAFLAHLYRSGNAERAVDFANCAAALSIEAQGIEGIPTLALVERRQQAGHGWEN